MHEKDNFTDVVESLSQQQSTTEQAPAPSSETQQVVNSEGEMVTLGNDSNGTIEK